MILTLAQMISRATTLAGGRLDWDSSDASFYVNEAVGYVARNSSVIHKSLESSYATTITSGVSRMRLPTDYNTVNALSIGSTVPSGSTSWRVLGKRDIGLADTVARRYDGGVPDSYVEYGEGFFEIVPRLRRGSREAAERVAERRPSQGVTYADQLRPQFVPAELRRPAQH